MWSHSPLPPSQVLTLHRGSSESASLLLHLPRKGDPEPTVTKP